MPFGEKHVGGGCGGRRGLGESRGEFKLLRCKPLCFHGCCIVAVLVSLYECSGEETLVDALDNTVEGTVDRMLLWVG